MSQPTTLEIRRFADEADTHRRPRPHCLRGRGKRGDGEAWRQQGRPRSGCSRSSPIPRGNPEGVAFDKRSRSFYVGITADGAIYRGSLKSDTVEPFIPGGTGKSAVGLKTKRGKLYVAGGATGSITVYDLATKAQVAKFDTGSGGFLNDLVVTRGGDVYVTDSLRPKLWHVTGEQVEAGSGTPQGLDVSAIPYDGRRLQRQRHRREELAQARRGRLQQRQAVPDQARRRRRLDRRRSTRSPAPRCPAATACCSTRASSWSSRATRPSCRS